MRTADAFMSFPSMVLILVLVAVFGPSILTVTVVIGILGWTAIAKLIYGNVLSIREREYIQAAKTSGTSTLDDPFFRGASQRDPAGLGQYSFRVAGRDPYGVFLKLFGNGRSDAAGFLGKYYLRRSEPDGADGPAWVWIPPGVCIILVVIALISSVRASETRWIEDKISKL